MDSKEEKGSIGGSGARRLGGGGAPDVGDVSSG